MCLYAYEYEWDTDLRPISFIGLFAPFAVHIPCHMIARMILLAMLAVFNGVTKPSLMSPWASLLASMGFFTIEDPTEYLMIYIF